MKKNKKTPVFIIVILLIILILIIILKLTVRNDINKIDNNLYDIGYDLYKKINIKEADCGDFYYLIRDNISFDDISQSTKLYIALESVDSKEFINDEDFFGISVPYDELQESYKLIFGNNKKINEVSYITDYGTCESKENIIYCYQEPQIECVQARYSYNAEYIGSYKESDYMNVLIKIIKEDNFNYDKKNNTSENYGIYKAIFKLDDSNNWYWTKTKAVAKKLFSDYE